MKLDHAARMISDPEAPRSFYVDVLGLEEIPRPPIFTFPGLWLAMGDHQLHLVGEAVAGRTSETHPGYTSAELETGYASHFALEVDDLSGFLSGVRLRGGEVVGGPRPPVTACSRPTWPTRTAT